MWGDGGRDRVSHSYPEVLDSVEEAIILIFCKTLKLLKGSPNTVTVWDWKFPKSELKVGSNDHVMNNLEHDWENVNELSVRKEILNQKRAGKNINGRSCNKFSSDIRFP